MATRTPATYLQKAGRAHLPAFYLQLMGIICSLAFTYFLSGIEKRLPLQAWTTSDWLQHIATLHIIIITWHEYATGSAYFRWVLTIVDSAIPFAFGIFLFAAVYQNTQNQLPSWLYAIASFCIVGAMAYANQYVNATRDRSNVLALKGFRGYHGTAIAFSLVSAGAFLAIGLLFDNQFVPQEYSVAAVGAVNLLLIIFTYTVLRFQRRATSTVAQT